MLIMYHSSMSVFKHSTAVGWRFSVDGLFLNPTVTLMYLKPQERYRTWKTPNRPTHHQTINACTTQLISDQQSSYGFSFPLMATALKLEPRGPPDISGRGFKRLYCIYSIEYSEIYSESAVKQVCFEQLCVVVFIARHQHTRLFIRNDVRGVLKSARLTSGLWVRSLSCTLPCHFVSCWVQLEWFRLYCVVERICLGCFTV